MTNTNLYLFKRANILKLEDLILENEYQIYGRVVRKRNHPGVVFLDLDSNIQIAFRNFNLVEKCKLGDLIYVTGMIENSSSGLKTLFVSNLDFYIPCGVEIQKSYYQNKSDLYYLTDNSYAEKIKLKSKFINAIREFLLERNYFETITPVLQPFQSGANAHGFLTYNNYLEKNMYLRIAMECYLKRLMVRGIDNLFEIGTCFRNEDASSNYNYEFTMLEAYTSNRRCDFTINIIKELIIFLCQKFQLEIPSFNEYDLCTEVSIYLNIPDVKKVTTINEMSELFKEDLSEHATSVGECIDYIFSKKIAHTKTGFYFIKNFPKEITPLAGICEDDDYCSESADFMFNDIELGTLYTEQTDPKIQRDAFQRQPTENIDIAFLDELELGLQPCSGFGLGIERMLKVFFQTAQIKDFISFSFSAIDFPKK